MVAVFGLSIALAVVYFQSPTPPPAAPNVNRVIDDPQLEAARQQARATLDTFLEVYADPLPNTQGYSVKISVFDNDKVEYFWVYPFQTPAADTPNDNFRGRINDDPTIVNNVFKGQQVEFSYDDIVDWTYDSASTKNMFGNFSGCVSLYREAPDNAQQFQELYGLDCSFLEAPPN